MSVQLSGRGSDNNVAALYDNCFKQLDSIIAHLDLDELSIGVQSRLSIEKVRYLLWGESVGLVHRDPKAEQVPNPKLGDSIQQFKIFLILQEFLFHLTRPKGIGLDYNSLQTRRSPDQGPRALNIFDQTFEQFAECLATQSQDWMPGPKWIIYDPEEFATTIIQDLMELVDELEKLTAATEPIKAQHARIRAEVMSISDFEKLRLIRDAANECYPYIHNSAVDRLASITDVTEEMFPLTWTDSIATTMRGQSVHASDYSITEPSTLPFRKSLLRGLAVARSAVPTFRLGRSGRRLQTHSEIDENENHNIPEISGLERHKIVVLGDQCVGKTALTVMFCRQHYVTICDPTIEDSYTKSSIIDGKQCILEILDTSGDEVYAALRQRWISGGEAFMLAYGIHNRSTLVTARKNGLLIRGKPAVVVGISFTDDFETVARTRVVSREEGLALAKDLECGFVEASAKDEHLVEKAFKDVVRQIRKRAVRERG